MKISCTIADPTGNITALVTSPVAHDRRAAVVRALMTGNVEQVGFVCRPQCGGEARLEMMGGEFCGNASMSLAALLCAGQAGAPVDVLLEVSGADRLVRCTAEQIRDDVYRGSADMPLPQRIERHELPGLEAAAPVVFFPGIAHVLVPGGQTVPEERMADWCARLGAEALGVLPFAEDICRIDPVVWVPAAGSLVHEHGCGSGSAAVGAYLAQRTGGPVEVSVSQPGGNICVSASSERIVISGDVRLCRHVQSEME